MRVHILFKLFSSIKEPQEVDFAELELRTLFGDIQRVRNFFDTVKGTPFEEFFTNDARLQDILLYEPCYGECQGFYGTKDGDFNDFARMLKRVAYTREILFVGPSKNVQKALEQLPPARSTKTVRLWENGANSLCRAITNQYYLEKSHYVSKLSRNEAEIDRNVEILLNYPFENLYRIPASSTMAVGKRLEDYFAIREEISLYLTHMLHPYKGKFHAKMVRALLNYIHPSDDGIAMDNFAGSGTLNLEATLMGLDNVGVEINPLSALMANVKCNCLRLEPETILSGIESLVKEVQSQTSQIDAQTSGTLLLIEPKYSREKLEDRKARVPESVRRVVGDNLDYFMLTEGIIKSQFKGELKDFLILGLSGTISDLARHRSHDFLHALVARLHWMYLRVYLFHKLNNVLEIDLGKSETYVGDTRDLFSSLKRMDGQTMLLERESVDSILNSPPYSTALDYVRNDLPQLTVLDIAEGLEPIELNMIGNPNLKFYPETLHSEINNRNDDFDKLPVHAKDVILSLLRFGRKPEALRVYKFYKDMRLTLVQMFEILGPAGKAVIIIGNNHYKLDGEYQEVANDVVIDELAKSTGFSVETNIKRELEKTMTGMIRYETIIVLKKK